MTVTGTPSQVIEAYLDHLRQMLVGAEPAEREEILASVREHLHDSLGALRREPTVVDAQAALDELGPAEDVVRAWADGGDPNLTAVEVVEPGTRDRRLLAVGTIALSICSLAVTVLNPILAAGLQLSLAVIALVAARKATTHTSLYRAAATIASVGVIVSTVVILTLFSANDAPAQPDEPVPVRSGPG